MINGTVIVQAINFFIGYFLLKYIFLRPGLKLVQKNIYEEEKLNHSIVSLRKQIAEQKLAQGSQWQKMTKKICSDKPPVDERVQLDCELFVEPIPEVDPEEDRALIKEVKEVIFTQVSQE